MRARVGVGMCDAVFVLERGIVDVWRTGVGPHCVGNEWNAEH